MGNPKTVASIVFAAGRGTRMTGYSGNKTLLPLVPERSSFEGSRPLIVEVLNNLPAGPKGVVLNYRAEDVRRVLSEPGLTFIRQPETNGTGGALLAARSFIESVSADSVIITMGDVPLIRPATYEKLLDMLENCDLTLLAFEFEDRAQYGMIETREGRVAGIVEWKYWKDFPEERRAALKYCNAGVYAAQRTHLLKYMDRMEKMPHQVKKERNGEWVTIKEYFLTDLAEMMNKDGLPVGMTSAAREEVTGVDTPSSLEAVQKLYATIMKNC